MEQTIGELLPHAVGVAISPLPTVAAILLLTTGKSSNSLMFLLGWFAGLFGVALAVVALESVFAAPDGGASTTSGVMELVLGLLISIPNPPNLALSLTAGIVIVSTELSRREQLGAIGFYAVIGSTLVALPIILYFGFRSRAETTLQDMRAWLVQENATINHVGGLQHPWCQVLR